jgi:hypothetical protein
MRSSSERLGKKEERASFFEKKEAKKLSSWGRGHPRGQRPQDQKFFGYFFSKK